MLGRQFTDIEKHVANHLHHYKIQQRLLDAHNTKAQSLIFRKHIIEKQKMTNYENEYDRIRGILASSVAGRAVGTTNLDHVKNRAKELENLGASAHFNLI
jgi:hypothetical protein